MESDSPYTRYQELQQYVGWTDEDARRVQSLAPVVTPHFDALIDDFYAEIERHHAARRVITGGEEQIKRLKQTLKQWLAELLAGSYNREYVERRWRVGRRHAEMGSIRSTLSPPSPGSAAVFCASSKPTSGAWMPSCSPFADRSIP